MAITVKVGGVEMPIVDYVVKLVKTGKTDKARRAIAEIYGAGYNRAEKTVTEIQKKISKSERQDRVFSEFIDDITA